MERSIRLFPFRLLCLLLLGMMAFSTALAQSKRASDSTPANEEQALQQLLKEVRLMRLALEHATGANTDGYRAQIAVERLRIQQEHVDRLARQLDSVRNELTDLKTSQQQIADRAKELEDIVRTTNDIDQKTEAQNQLKDVRNAIDQQSGREQIRREQERQLAMQLQIEQTRLGDLNDLLEKLERRLESSSTTEPPSAGGKRP